MRGKISSAAILLALFGLTGAGLPETGPLPDHRPGEETSSPAKPEAAPVPDQKPDTVPEDKNTPVPQPKPQDASESKPSSPSTPSTSQEPKAADKAPEPAKPEEEKKADTPAEAPKPVQSERLEEQHLVIEPESEEDHAACKKELEALGVRFEDLGRIDDDNGCGIDRPIKVKEILPGIKMDPDAVFRCPVARALAHWLKESVIPAASVALPDHGAITTVNQASSYICRLRNSAETGKISEHARGNAIDIASFSFEKKDPVEVRPRKEDSTLEGAFQRAVSASACLYFATVLDPESDAAHENHFHLDVLERKGGYRYCH